MALDTDSGLEIAVERDRCACDRDIVAETPLGPHALAGAAARQGGRRRQALDDAGTNSEPRKEESRRQGDDAAADDDDLRARPQRRQIGMEGSAHAGSL